MDFDSDNGDWSHGVVNFNQIIMGIVDKNYLNKVNQKIQNDLKNQPCGCDCHCRPKFEDNGTPIPPTCNCRINDPNQIVGDYTDGRGIFSTPQTTLPIVGGQNCPMTIQFVWNSGDYSGTVTLKTSTQVIPMTIGIYYTITLNPGDWYFFSFVWTPDVIDHIVTIECINDTCGESYGQVGQFTAVAI